MLHDNRDEMLASNADIQSYFAGYGFDVSGTDLGYTAGQAVHLSPRIFRSIEYGRQEVTHGNGRRDTSPRSRATRWP